MGIKNQTLMDLARQGCTSKQSFSMIILALKMANHRNAVIQRHGKGTRRMWQTTDCLDSTVVCYNGAQGL